jgi:alpha-ketoglutarate-dependent taurine dioxygenase
MTTVSIGTRLDVRKITARIGAVVSGLSPDLVLDPETVAAVREALNEHKALVFRGVDLDDEGQQRFASYFGPVTAAHPTVPAVDGEPNVLPVDSYDGPVNYWHTDVTFVLNPPQASTLRSIIVPPYGGETLIANTGAAYRDLPEPLRAFADTLWAIHSNDYDYVKPPESLSQSEKDRRELFLATKYETAHPVVRVHPLTGERNLFIGGFVQRIVGLPKADSRDVIRLFQQYVTRPENILRVVWEPGQLVLFDNRITQHYAVGNYDDEPRRLNRVTVAGDIPVGIDGSQSYSVKGDASSYSPVFATAAAG